MQMPSLIKELLIFLCCMLSYKIAENFAEDVSRSRFNGWMILLFIDVSFRNYLLILA